MAVTMVLTGLVFVPSLSFAETNANIDSIVSLRSQIVELQLKLRTLLAHTKSLQAEAMSEARADAKSDKMKDKEEREDDREERREEWAEKKLCKKANKGVGLALGHLFAPGWLKTRGDDCVKLPPSASTTPSDTTTPMISTVLVAEGSGEAILTWTTSENTTSSAFLSLSSPVTIGASGVVEVKSDSNGRLHRAKVTNLSALTKYYILVRAEDKSGNVGVSTETSFTTKAEVDMTAPIQSAIGISAVASSTATVNWKTNEAASSQVYYGKVSPLILADAGVKSDSSLTTDHHVTLTNLSSGTSYFVVVSSTDASGNLSQSSEFVFTTSQ